MMNPFVTKGYAGSAYFCDRARETRNMVDLLTNDNNVALISPRRLGKTDLIRHTFCQPEIQQHYYTFLIDIYATNQKNTMLCDIDLIKDLVNSKFVSYSYCYDRKILKNDVILIDIAYLEDSKICNTFSSELVLLFRDSYGNLYEQPFFIQQKNLYEPHKISNNEYKVYTLTETAIECFKKPWLW